jgi:nucleoside-diphosphate-sugar epimerase
MNLLILGGTGAMGGGILNFLSGQGDQITVTSRSTHLSTEKNIRFVQGNAKDMTFLKELLAGQYDVIIDFMSYSTEEFRQRYKMLLAHTRQYVFISSARVYAQSDRRITEETPRLLDISADKEYLSTDEYALAKARCEDILAASNQRNYTIIRPSITYNTYRLQLGVLEKEGWLYRALQGRSIVFSEDIACKYTAMTHGQDVAKGICSVLGKSDALGKVFHITSEESLPWSEILKVYLSVIEKETGHAPKVVITPKAVNLKLKGAKYQVIYCRYFDRKFDNSKIRQFINADDFISPALGLSECLREFLKKPSFREINWTLEAWNDKAAHERTPLKEIPTFKKKAVYLCHRYGMDWALDVYKKFIG